LSPLQIINNPSAAIPRYLKARVPVNKAAIALLATIDAAIEKSQMALTPANEGTFPVFQACLRVADQFLLLLFTIRKNKEGTGTQAAESNPSNGKVWYVILVSLRRSRCHQVIFTIYAICKKENRNSILSNSFQVNENIHLAGLAIYSGSGMEQC